MVTIRPKGFEMPDEHVLGDPELSREFTRLQVAVPEVTEHRQALKVLGADFSYIRRHTDGTWTALINPGDMLAGRFGLTRDVMLIYTVGHELQPRVLREFNKRLRDIPRHKACEDHFAIIWSVDPNAAGKLSSWAAAETTLGIYLQRGGRPDALATGLFTEMLRKLASRNLYDETLPVTGDDFFGRRRELTQLQEELRQGKVCGVFGLRKSGKTSLVKELGRRFTLDGDRRIFVLRDLESLPSHSPRIRIDMIQELRQGFLSEFRTKGIRRGDLTDLELNASVGDFKRALKVSLADCEKRGIQVVLALDEIEFLVGDAKTLEEGSRPEVPELLGALRSLVQEHSIFNVVLAGITSSIVHRGSLYGAENPLFNWARPYYIQPMSRLEINGLTTDVGRRMGVTWTPQALDAVYASSQGNVFMHRTFAAAIVSRMDQNVFPMVIEEEDVTRSHRSWRRDTAERLEQMFMSFERHYPTEAGLLRLVVAEDSTWSEVDEEFPAEVSRLMELSLVRESGSGELDLGPLARTLAEARVL